MSIETLEHSSVELTPEEEALLNSAKSDFGVRQIIQNVVMRYRGCPITGDSGRDMESGHRWTRPQPDGTSGSGSFRAVWDRLEKDSSRDIHAEARRDPAAVVAEILLEVPELDWGGES